MHSRNGSSASFLDDNIAELNNNMHVRTSYLCFYGWIMELPTKMVLVPESNVALAFG